MLTLDDGARAARKGRRGGNKKAWARRAGPAVVSSGHGIFLTGTFITLTGFAVSQAITWFLYVSFR